MSTPLTETKEEQNPLYVHNHPFAKHCCMTIFMHDLAFPPEPKGLWPLNWNPPSTPVQIYTNVSMDLVRTLSDVELGRIIRDTLTKVDEFKNKIENK